MWDRMSIAITLLALLIEATLGYPDRVLRAIGHPVMWIGRMIDWLDRTLNRETRSGGRAQGRGLCRCLPDRRASRPLLAYVVERALFCCCRSAS